VGTVALVTSLSGPNCNALAALKVTQGGQLTAPLALAGCAIRTVVAQGDPCLRGQWQHVRLYRGKANPRSEFVVDTMATNNPKGAIDSMQWACLPCDANPTVGRLPGSLCNPDNPGICGATALTAP